MPEITKIKRKASESRSEISHILPHAAINGADRLLGSFILGCVDEVTAVAARRFCRTRVTTAVIDSVEFLAPAKLGELFTATGVVTRAGNTSVEVRADGYVEEDDGSRRHIFRAFVVVVAVDENGSPIPVPELICETDEEKAELALADERDRLRKLRRNLGK